MAYIMFVVVPQNLELKYTSEHDAAQGARSERTWHGDAYQQVEANYAND